ncbi:glycosylation-dependent cell adhesion molecule 1-like [Urocitellus parryii]
MKLFTVLLLASLASTSLAILHGEYSLLLIPSVQSEDEIPVKTQVTNDWTDMAMADCFSPGALSLPHTPSISLVPASQFASINHPRKASISSEDLTVEPFILSEELISKENVVIQSTRPMSQTPEILHPVLQGDSSKSSIEETTEFTPTAGMSQGREEMTGEVLRRKGQGSGSDLDGNKVGLERGGSRMKYK